jgi:hypothetical protein
VIVFMDARTRSAREHDAAADAGVLFDVGDPAFGARVVLRRSRQVAQDIVSTARTMIATVGHLLHAGMTPPICVAVRAVFARRAYEDLVASGTTPS